MSYSSARRVRPRSMHVSLLILALVALSLSSVSIQAQQAVAVTDQQVENNTGNIKNNTDDIKKNTGNISKQIGGSTSGEDDTVNGHLKHIDTFDPAPSSALRTVAKPEVDIDTVGAPSADTASCGGRAQAQLQNCKDIIATKNARFTYMKAMYDMALKRQSTLNDLQDTRRNLDKEEFGKLQDNTNQVLTLIAQMQIDRQEMQSIDKAYAARLEYLQNQQSRLAKSATEPGSNGIISNIASQAIAGLVLQEALHVQASAGTKPLDVENSSGW